jgi:hypothetical protein
VFCEERRKAAGVRARRASRMLKKLVLRIERQQDDLPNAALFC